MTTDKTLEAWQKWLSYAISKVPNSPLAGIPIRLRDTEETKHYPGIYISEGSVDRIEAGGVADGNAWNVEIETALATTPGDDGQIATSKVAHDIMRNALSVHVNDCRAQEYLDSQIGLFCHEIYTSSPVTSEEDAYRVTRWTNKSVCGVY